MGKNEEPDRSELFLVRLWIQGEDRNGEGRDGGEDAAANDGGSRMRGKVQHVLSGRAASFDNWRALMQQLCMMMPRQAGAERSSDIEGK